MYTLCVPEIQRATYNGVWRSLANAPALGAGDRRFESCHSDGNTGNGVSTWCSLRRECDPHPVGGGSHWLRYEYDVMCVNKKYGVSQTGRKTVLRFPVFLRLFLGSG